MPKLTTYIRDNYQRKDGTSAVCCLFYIKRQRVVIPTGVTVAPAEWDAARARVKGKSQEARDANLIIQDVRAKINDVFVRFRLDGREITRASFFKEFLDTSSYTDFWDFFSQTLEKRRGSIAENTYRAQKSTIKKLQEVIPGLQFRDLTDETLRDMRKRLAQKPWKNSSNTITKNMITLKTYVLIAIRKKLMDENPFVIEKIRRGKSNQVWLTEIELEKLTRIYREGKFAENLNKVLQYFLFSAFTGMRLSDVKNFSMEQIKGEFIIINPIKTKRTSNEMVSIPITKPIRRIIGEAARYRLRGKVFDCYADAVTNRMLKKIAELAGINKELSFHSARHTFASIFLEKTDDLATLQKLLGHSSIAQTMVYVHMTERKKVEQMRKCWDTILDVGF
jgi:site-specific recombinase XerD